ncbi:phosphatase protein [Salix suchowensis]|nr:phosphatase protein [Salix suchowensis]
MLYPSRPENIYLIKSRKRRPLKIWRLRGTFSRVRGVQHSASSTLLLDDSPLKAWLQPWNHLCVKEYTSEMRLADLQVVSKDSTPSDDINAYYNLDLMLLAVIGALDAIKWESNVAGWVQSGGLSLKGADSAEPPHVEDSQFPSKSHSAGPPLIPVLPLCFQLLLSKSSTPLKRESRGECGLKNLQCHRMGYPRAMRVEGTWFRGRDRHRTG